MPRERRVPAGGVTGLAPRDLVPLAVASAASVAVIGVAVLPWLGPVLLVALVLVARREPRSPARLGRARRRLRRRLGGHVASRLSSTWGAT